MDTSDAMSINEAELHLLFEEAGLTETPAPNLDRVNSVIERSLHEKAIKDTASFVFLGFPSAAIGLFAAATNSVRDPRSDYRA